MKLTIDRLRVPAMLAIAAALLLGGCDRVLNADGATALDSPPVYAAATTYGWNTHLTRLETQERRPNNDVALLIKVKTALSAEPSLARFALDAGVLDGVVTLYGEVETSEHRAVAERIARRIQGVEEVKSGIAVIQRG
jgi:hypothetical protein